MEKTIIIKCDSKTLATVVMEGIQKELKKESIEPVGEVQFPTNFVEEISKCLELKKESESTNGAVASLVTDKGINTVSILEDLINGLKVLFESEATPVCECIEISKEIRSLLELLESLR